MRRNEKAITNKTECIGAEFTKRNQVAYLSRKIKTTYTV